MSLVEPGRGGVFCSTGGTRRRGDSAWCFVAKKRGRRRGFCAKHAQNHQTPIVRFCSSHFQDLLLWNSLLQKLRFVQVFSYPKPQVFVTSKCHGGRWLGTSSRASMTLSLAWQTPMSKDSWQVVGGFKAVLKLCVWKVSKKGLKPSLNSAWEKKETPNKTILLLRD